LAESNGSRKGIPFIADESEWEVVENLLRQHSHSQSSDEQEGDLNPGGHETLLENDDIGLQLSFPTISCGEIFKGQ